VREADSSGGPARKAVPRDQTECSPFMHRPPHLYPPPRHYRPALWIVFTALMAMACGYSSAAQAARPHAKVTAKATALRDCGLAQAGKGPSAAKDKQGKKTKKRKCLAAKASAAGSYAMQPAVREAADAIAQSHALSRSWVRATLAQAQMLPEVVRAVTPAPDPGVRNWQTYRNRMVEPVRVQAGVQFWLRNAKVLEQAERQTGVPASLVVGILGVETLYGKRMGKYRVLDALATLAFDFPASHPKAPARAAYFLQELEAFLVWCQATGRDPLTVLGSYAGAMGIAQFMPSSWQKYAVDFDADGQIDLFDNNTDAIGSVANYLAAFGWKAGMPTHYPVQLDAARLDLPALLEKDILPSMSPAQMAERGALLPPQALQHTGQLALIELLNGNEAPASYVVGTDNFYVVTRYNWSSFYAMAVIELGHAVQAQLPAGTANLP
jgi:membrane-bound lytic murein transglycosylase B